MTEGAGRQRLVSLDTFRGLTIAAMILVNNPGNWGRIYAPLRHAAWHGWTPTDWIFPFFLFIMGVALALSLQSRREAGLVPGVMWRKVLRRAAILFLLGLFLSGYPSFDLETLRTMGVLQRIALCYLLLTGTVLWVPKLRYQWLVMATFLAIYLAVMLGLEVPGYGRGDWSPEGNAGGYLDRLILGPAHLLLGGPYDPEGLVTTLGAVLSGFIGWLFGRVLVRTADQLQIVRRWLAWSIMLTAAGWLLGWIMPINKQLWTPSYVLFTGGLAGLGLAACYWLMEMRRITVWGRPFAILGRNSLAIFWLSGFLVRNLVALKVGTDGGSVSAWTWLYRNGFANWLPAYPASLAFALANVAFWLGVAWILYRRRIFIKL